jgi:hypothetical protein
MPPAVQRYASSFIGYDESASDVRLPAMTHNVCEFIGDILRRRRMFLYGLTLLEEGPADSIEEERITQLNIAVVFKSDFGKALEREYRVQCLVTWQMI